MTADAIVGSVDVEFLLDEAVVGGIEGHDS